MFSGIISPLLIGYYKFEDLFNMLEKVDENYKQIIL